MKIRKKKARYKHQKTSLQRRFNYPLTIYNLFDVLESARLHHGRLLSLYWLANGPQQMEACELHHPEGLHTLLFISLCTFYFGLVKSAFRS